MHLHTDVARLPDRSRLRMHELNRRFRWPDWLDGHAESLVDGRTAHHRDPCVGGGHAVLLSRLAQIPNEGGLPRSASDMHALQPHTDLISVQSLRERTYCVTPFACRPFGVFGAGR